MQIEYSTSEYMTFTVTNTGGDDAIGIFNAILRKCRKECMKKGFNNMFTDVEKAFIKEFTDKVLDNEVGC